MAWVASNTQEAPVNVIIGRHGLISSVVRPKGAYSPKLIEMYLLNWLSISGAKVNMAFLIVNTKKSSLHFLGNKKFWAYISYHRLISKPVGTWVGKIKVLIS